MRRKNTLDGSVQAEAKIAFRQLRLEINQLHGIYRRHRPQQYRNMPPLDPTVVRSLLSEAQRLCDQVANWLSVVEGHHPAHLINSCHKLDRTLAMLEMELEWEHKLATRT